MHSCVKQTEQQSAFSLDVSDLFSAVDLPCKVVVEINEHTYEIDMRDPKSNWLYPAFLAFQKLQTKLNSAQKKVDTFVSIGTGAGIDAIGAFEIFRPRTLIVTDIHPGVLPLAERNLRQHVKDSSSIYHAWQGNLAEPLRQHDILADVIYANLPNIPFSKQDNVLLSKQLTSSFYLSTTKKIPMQYHLYLLDMQYTFLRDIRESLADGGSLVVNFGGRVPTELVKDMFVTSGYSYEELFVMLKSQSQPELILPSYARAEKDYGVTFDFYLLDQACEILDKNQNTAKTSHELKQILMDVRISATTAEQLFLKHQKRIGHIVQVIRAQVCK